MTQMQIEGLTDEEYSFFLANGVINDESLQLQQLVEQLTHADVEM